MLGRWNPISQTILEWQWIVLHWIEHLPWNDFWNPVVTKTEQTHYGPWQSQYHTVQPKGPPNAGPWKLTQWSPQTVANAWRDAAFISSAISLAISLVMTGMMSMTRSDIFSNVLGDSLRSVRNIFSAIDSQDLVTIAWANVPRELYNVKIRKGVVFKGLGFQQALGLGPSPGSGKPNQTTQLLALALVSLRIQQPILRSIGVNFKHGGCISQWKAWKMSGFATPTPSSQQVFGTAFRLQSLEIQNCHSNFTRLPLGSPRTTPGTPKLSPNIPTPSPNTRRSKQLHGFKFFLIYFEHWHMHGLEALWAQYLLKFHGVYLKLVHSKHQHIFAEKWWYGNAMGCLALPRWFLFKPASNMGRWTNNCNFGRIISFQNFGNTAHFELSQLRGCKYMQAIYNT